MNGEMTYRTMRNAINTFTACLMLLSVSSCQVRKSGDTTPSNDTAKVAVDTTQEVEADEDVDETPTDEKIKSAPDAETVQTLLDGTTWHYTENLDDSEVGCWLKVVFSGTDFTTYYALPSDGYWTRDSTGTYEVREGRYANTGERYISIHWGGHIKNPILKNLLSCDMAMTTDNFQLNVHSPVMDAVLWKGNGMMEKVIMKGRMAYGDYSWD